MWIGVASSGLSCNLSALAPRGLQRPGAEPCRCHLLRSSQRTRPGNQARSTCGYPAEGERLRSRPFPLGEVSWGQTGAGPYGEVLAGLRRRAEARRLYCFGDRAAAAATKTVLVSAAGIGAALGKQQRGRRPLAVLRRGGPGAERSSCATVSTAGGDGGALVRLRPRSAAGGGRGTGPSLLRDAGPGAQGGKAWGGERNPRGSGLHVSPFGALPSWGPSFLGLWLGQSPDSGARGRGLLIKFHVFFTMVSQRGPREAREHNVLTLSQSDLAREAGDSQLVAEVGIDAPSTSAVTTSPSLGIWSSRRGNFGREPPDPINTLSWKVCFRRPWRSFY